MGCRFSKAAANRQGFSDQLYHEEKQGEQLEQQDAELFSDGEKDHLTSYKDLRGEAPLHTGEYNPFAQDMVSDENFNNDAQPDVEYADDGSGDLRCLIERVGECDRAMKSCYDQIKEISKSSCGETVSFFQSTMPECFEGTTNLYDGCAEGCGSLCNTVVECTNSIGDFCSSGSDLCECKESPCNWISSSADNEVKQSGQQDEDTNCTSVCWNPFGCLMEYTNKEGNLKVYGDGENTAFHCNKQYELPNIGNINESNKANVTLMDKKAELFSKSDGSGNNIGLGHVDSKELNLKCTEWTPCPECRVYDNKYNPPPLRLNIFQCHSDELLNVEDEAASLSDTVLCGNCFCCPEGVNGDDDKDDNSSGVGDAMVSSNHFQRGDKVMYRGMHECTILERHVDDPMDVYYTILLSNNGREVQTIASYISAIPPENSDCCCQSCCSCFCCTEDKKTARRVTDDNHDHQASDGACCCDICDVCKCTSCCSENENNSSIVNIAPDVHPLAGNDNEDSCCNCSCLFSCCSCCSCCSYPISSYGATINLLIALRDYAEGYAASHRYQHLSPIEVYSMAIKQLTAESKSSLVGHFRSFYYYEKHPILGLKFDEAFGLANICVRINYRSTFRFVSVVQATEDYLNHRPGKYPRNQTYLWLDMLVSNPWSSEKGMVLPSAIDVFGDDGDWKDILIFERSSMYQSNEVSVDTLSDVIEGAQAFGSSSASADQAIILYERALEELQHVYGETDTHKDTILVLHKLSGLLISKKRHKEAYGLLLREYISLERSKGLYDEKVISILSKLGGVCQQLNRLEEARKWLEKCLVGKESMYGYSHEKTLVTVSNLAIVLKNLGDFDAAKIMFDRELSGCELVHGVDHVSTLMTVYNIGNFLYGRLNYSEAFKYFERAHKGFEKQEGPESAKTKMAAKAVLNVLSKLNENVFPKLSIESSYLSNS